MSAESSGPTTAFLPVDTSPEKHRRSNSLSSAHYSHRTSNVKKRRKGYSEHVSRLQLILATTGKQITFITLPDT